MLLVKFWILKTGTGQNLFVIATKGVMFKQKVYYKTKNRKDKDHILVYIEAISCWSFLVDSDKRNNLNYI